MNKLSSMVILVLSVMVVFSACKKEDQHSNSADMEKARMELAKQTDQKICPVMGEKINPEIFVDHNGKRIYFCCNSCVEKFKADPEQYMKKLKALKLQDVPDKG